MAKQRTQLLAPRHPPLSLPLPSICASHCLWLLLLIASLLLYASQLLFAPCFRSHASPDHPHGSSAHDPALIRPAVEDDPAYLASHWTGSLLRLQTAWNALAFEQPPPEALRIAVFVRRWPEGDAPAAGGLEHHALTLHQFLAARGHDVRVFTALSNATSPTTYVLQPNLYIHSTRPSVKGDYEHNHAWKEFLRLNLSKPFDVIHSESVSLPHWKAKGVRNLVASWHGIQFESIHSDIVQELARSLEEPRNPELQEILSKRLLKVTDEIRLLSSYEHHVGVSDFAGEILRTIYDLPLSKVHVILDGVDESKFQPDPERGLAFRRRIGVPSDAKLVFGAAGRLVKDKGHSWLFQAFSEILNSYSSQVYLLIAGEGPWASRYRELEPKVKVLGSMRPSEMADFYRAIDIFVDPTMRSQGVDQALLEAMLCGKPLLATRFASITRNVIVDSSIGYTFSPNAKSLKKALLSVMEDGKEAVSKKGGASFRHASRIFTATKMGLAYERLFLCIKKPLYCHYPLLHFHHALNATTPFAFG